jgi:hypothetical protein
MQHQEHVILYVHEQFMFIFLFERLFEQYAYIQLFYRSSVKTGDPSAFCTMTFKSSTHWTTSVLYIHVILKMFVPVPVSKKIQGQYLPSLFGEYEQCTYISESVVLTAMSKINYIFLFITWCSSEKLNRCFGGTSHIRLQCRKQPRNQHQAGSEKSCLLEVSPGEGGIIQEAIILFWDLFVSRLESSLKIFGWVRQAERYPTCAWLKCKCDIKNKESPTYILSPYTFTNAFTRTQYASCMLVSDLDYYLTLKEAICSS